VNPANRVRVPAGSLEVVMRSTVEQSREANQRRRDLAAAKQKPLPLAEQRRRADERAAAHRARYPHPPVYTEPNSTRVRQPACYGPSDFFAALLIDTMLRRARRRSA
jgi:hypothetical protein